METDAVLTPAYDTIRDFLDPPVDTLVQTHVRLRAEAANFSRILYFRKLRLGIDTNLTITPRLKA